MRKGDGMAGVGGFFRGRTMPVDPEECASLFSGQESAGKERAALGEVAVNRRKFEGEQRVFADGRVVVQQVEEQTVLVNGVYTTARVAQCVQADCGCAVIHLADLYQCCVCGAVVCNRCAAKCMACSRVACAPHAMGVVDQERSLLLCALCVEAMNTPKWLFFLKGWWGWLRG